MAAINKRKILESAQRHLQKGALDKALKDYQTVLNADPRDTSVRLKCGDLLQRMGRNDEAITSYLKVADQFQRDGFDAKAVALYKQVTKIDDKRHDLYVPLADLYQRLGLVSEAMGALQTAADAFHRDGRKREALDLLRRMAGLDPANVTSRLKVAELLRQEGLNEEAVAEFREAAAECERQGDWEARAGALERVVEAHPECIDELEALCNIWLDHGQARRAHQYAQKLVEADLERPDSQEVLARVLSALGQEELAIDAFRACAEAWRVRGEEAKAREIVQRHLPPQDFSSLANSGPGLVDPSSRGDGNEGLFGAAGELGGEAGVGEGVFGSEPIEIGDGGAVELGGDDAPFDPSAFAPEEAVDPDPEAAAPEDPPSPSSEPAPEGDLEQLLAEAAVYLRYRKHERAIASLQAALQQEPANLVALEQLGEAHVIAGAPDQAVEAWSRAAHEAAAAGEAARCVVLRGRIAELDPNAAAALELTVAEPAATDEITLDDPSEGLEEIDIDIDADALDPESEPDEASAPSADATSDDATSDEVDAGTTEFELDLDLDEGDDGADEHAAATTSGTLEAAASEPASELPTPPALEPEPALDLADADEESPEGADAAASMLDENLEDVQSTSSDSWELPFDESDESDGSEGDSDEPSAAAAETPSPPAAERTGDATPALRELTTDPGQQIQEDFEEASFYFEQGLFGEAEAIYQRVLERAPNHPGALLRLGEIAVQRGEAPGPLSDPDEQPVRSQSFDIEPPDALDLTTPTLDEDASRAWVDAIEPAQDPNDSTADVVDVDSNESIEDATETPPAPRAETAAPSVVDEPELTTPDLGHGESPAGASFDLAAELSAAMTDSPSGGAGTDEDGFASLFRDFKRGVSQTLGEGDVETHFDLGIAYREMGLLEDAIGEFRYALGFPSRRLDALQLMGLCALDLGRAQDAVGHLEQALASPDIPAEREAPLRYELGRAYHALPDRARALETFRRVVELEPGFQDVEERVAELEREDDPTAAADESAEAAEAYESFDDLVAEAADTAPPAAAERFETFDDLVAEANDEPEADAVADTIDADTDAAFVEASVVDEDDDGSAHEPYAAEPISEAELEEEPVADSEPDSEPQPAEPATSTPRRRRKVSFV